jgi:hypothetical protein
MNVSISAVVHDLGTTVSGVQSAVVLSGIKLVHDVPYTGDRRIDAVGALLSVLGMGGIVLSILVWQEGGVGRGDHGGRRGRPGRARLVAAAACP